jgi:hypothetical protein
MLLRKVVQKIKTHILCSITCFPKLCRLCVNVEKYVYVRAEHATDGSVIRRLRLACLVSKVTDTHREYVILIAFPMQVCLRERD